MKFWRRNNVIRATLMFSSAGVLVETFDEHIFRDSSPPVVGAHREVEPPRGAAMFAVQFTHITEQTFEQLKVFRLHYYVSQNTGSLMEDYLAPVHNDLKMRAVIVGAESMNREHKQVLATLLVRSDQRAWEASPAFRQLLER